MTRNTLTRKKLIPWLLAAISSSMLFAPSVAEARGHGASRSQKSSSRSHGGSSRHHASRGRSPRSIVRHGVYITHLSGRPAAVAASEESCSEVLPEDGARFVLPGGRPGEADELAMALGSSAAVRHGLTCGTPVACRSSETGQLTSLTLGPCADGWRVDVEKGVARAVPLDVAKRQWRALDIPVETGAALTGLARMFDAADQRLLQTVWSRLSAGQPEGRALKLRLIQDPGSMSRPPVLLSMQVFDGDRMVDAAYRVERESMGATYTRADGSVVGSPFLSAPLERYQISRGLRGGSATVVRSGGTVRTRGHQGVDYAAPLGTPLYATADGIVSFAGWKGGYGNCLTIGHGTDYSTLYGHLTSFAEGISDGVAVRAGELIGYLGSTGHSTGPHVHYELRLRGNYVDPLSHRPASFRQLGETEQARLRALVALVGAPVPSSAATVAELGEPSFSLRAVRTLR